jgi:anti-sigma regulatory factor (Ser/Thr protein kinase)
VTDVAATSPAGTTTQPVLLTVPAEPAMSRVARLAASGLASLAGCSMDEIEDIKIAISEALIVLVEHCDGAPINISLAVTAADFRIVASTDLRDSAFDADHPDLRLSATVLSGVCTDHGIDVADGRAEIRATVGRAAT